MRARVRRVQVVLVHDTLSSNLPSDSLGGDNPRMVRHSRHCVYVSCSITKPLFCLKMPGGSTHHRSSRRRVVSRRVASPTPPAASPKRRLRGAQQSPEALWHWALLSFPLVQSLALKNNVNGHNGLELRPHTRPPSATIRKTLVSTYGTRQSRSRSSAESA